MGKINRNIYNYLINYNINDINKLEIYYGNLNFKNKFSKSLESEFFYKKLETFISYPYKEFSQTIYSYENHFFDTQNHYYISNLRHFILDFGILIAFKNNKLAKNDFSCKKNYTELKQSVTEFTISPDIKIQFISFNKKLNIKIITYINENIDITMNKLEELFFC
jgi:hypothetical protein